LISEKHAVRLALLRNTVHLVTARDCLRLRGLFQPFLERSLQSSVFARNLVGLNLKPVIQEATKLMKEKPRTLAELRTLLQRRWPDRDANSLAYAIRHVLPLVQLPPRGVWGKSSAPICTTAELWLGQPVEPKPSIDDLVRRYLAAFGPATVADMTSWSGLPRLRPAFERLRPQLRTFSDERDRELFDVPDGPLPDLRTPASTRFLPEFDNLVLGHQDRTRVIAFEHRYVVGNGMFLVHGFVAGVWRLSEMKGEASLTVSSFKPLKKAERTALAEEGEELLSFAAQHSARHRVDLVVAPPPPSWVSPSGSARS
jgi:Winged helix DNA-binding domain